jgi:hypothetical protein
MPNDILSLWPFPKRRDGVASAGSELSRRAGGMLLALAAIITLPGCGEEDETVTFGDDVRPIFNRRCTTCHRPGTPIGVDIQNPFAPTTAATAGLVASLNSWNIMHPGETPERNVVPGDPDNSFLMHKLTGESALPRNGNGGAPMPLQIEPLTEQELDTFETWVAQGATEQGFEPVRAIIGNEAEAEGKCIYCHYAGTPNPPNLSEPFGPDGIVNVKAIYRGDMLRVVPGDPERSLLIQKVRLNVPDSEYGAQMPYSYNALTTRQLDTVRQWILEGALP